MTDKAKQFHKTEVSHLKAIQFKDSLFLVYTTPRHIFHIEFQQWSMSETKHQTIQSNNMFQGNSVCCTFIYKHNNTYQLLL